MSAVRALVRRPGPLLADSIVTHLDRVPIDEDLAVEQWHAYVAALLADLGYEPVTVDISEFQKLEGFVTCLSVRLRE